MKAWTIADIPSQAGLLSVVTGANSGIGWHTALELARAGSNVVVAARTPAKGIDAVERIRKEVPGAKVRVEALDLASLDSVRAFARNLGNEGKIDLLVNNAGVMRVPTRELTEDGFEKQFGTNFVGPFALTMLLMPSLLRSDAPRVTTLSNGAANMGLKRINFDHLQGAKAYGPFKAYCQSKLADLMFSNELGRRGRKAGLPLISNAAHPSYARTNLQTSGPGRELNAIESFLTPFMSHDAAHGALPTLRAATAVDTTSGSYYAPDKMFHLKGDPVPVGMPMPKKIRVNSINPGGTDTEGARTLGVIGSDFEKHLITQTPLGRLGQPDDIAPVAIFLASDASRWLTGEIILASGGAR